MSPEEFEVDLQKEAEALDTLVKIYQVFDELVARTLNEYEEYLDPELVVVLEVIRYEVCLVTNGSVTTTEGKVSGLIKQLDDVLDEIRVLQVGKPTKGNGHEKDKTQ